MRQADRRARKKLLDAEEARLVAEREAEAKALEAARVERMADLEKRLLDAQTALQGCQERLDDATTLLALHYDTVRINAGGVSKGVCRIINEANVIALDAFNEATKRYWTCLPEQAVERAHDLIRSIEHRITTLPSVDDPITIGKDVTLPGTPVTQTVRNADRPVGNADRSQEASPISEEEQAWIDRQDRDPYDPYQDYVERMEAIAEGNEPDDDDDGERF
ncbi:hypothetical protein NS365_05470 [Aureimonas ureilytica]|uniref:Uncharacterized protein n=1 Tax=Aureimonas ureilytica TaxID=401562 RepID=A0A175RV77_9HYPH|nr:hypothetical protein [Aureimonas ureilytica]KTR06884.1 hypothetical protein NS365_05470 [Aureimonas ureilytica]